MLRWKSPSKSISQISLEVDSLTGQILFREIYVFWMIDDDKEELKKFLF